MTATTLAGTPEEAAALALIGGTSFGQTEVELLQQILVALCQ